MRALILACTAALLLVSFSARAIELQFDRIGTLDGLAQATATSIVEDADGFIWIGSQDGLSRYDGHRIKVFRVQRGRAGSLSDNYVNSLHVASDGALWIGTRSGSVDRYDARNERFNTFKLKPASTIVQALLDGPNGTIWLGSDQGLFKLEKGATAFAPAGSSQPIAALALNKAGELLAVGPSGVQRVDLTGAVSEFSATLGALAIAQTRSGDVWLGLQDGDVIQLSASGDLKQRLGSVDGLAGGLMAALKVDRMDRLWVASHRGLSRLNDDSASFSSWRHDPGDSLGLSGTRLQSLFEDSSGVMWIGTWTAGLNRLSPARSRFEQVRYRGESAGLPSNNVRALLIDQAENLYVGVLDGVGLLKRRPDGSFERFTLADGSQPLAGTFVQALAQDHLGHLWIATRGSGLIKLDPVSGVPQAFNASNSPLPHPDIYCLRFDARRNLLWVGTRGGGLMSVDVRDSRMRLFTKAQGLSSDNIFSLDQTRNGELIVGTEGAGLNVFNPDSGAVKVYRRDDSKALHISHNNITSFAEDASGGWWIGTQGGGLNYSKPDTLQARGFEHLTTANGLGADAIGALAITQRGKLWVSTTAGLTEIDLSTRELKNFNQDDGAQASGYYIGSFARDNQGVLYFGGLQGFTRIDPLAQWQDTSVARSRIVEVSVSGVPWLPGWMTEPPTNAPSAPYLKTLSLEPNASNIQFEFSALNFVNPKRNRFRYRLLGVDRDWVLADPRRPYALYSRIPAGNYPFEMSASNAAGDFAPATQLQVIQQAQWRSSLLAKILYGLAALGVFALYLAQRRRLRAREARALVRSQESEERLKLALWGSGDELWDMDLNKLTIRRENRLPHLKVNQDLGEISSLIDYAPYSHPADVRRFNEAFAAHLKGLTPAFELRFRTRRLDDAWTWVLVRGRVVARDANGRVNRVVGTMRSIDASVAIEEELRTLNEALESRVAARTEELEETLNQLQSMQSQLVQSEKMASLGGLVAGVAHEINTPLGVSVTAASHLEEETQRLSVSVANGRMTRSTLDHYLQIAAESSSLILRNLKRAAGLVKSFKQVAVDQSSEVRRVFNLREYLEEILTSLRPELKRTKHLVELDVPADIELKSYPGALTQVIVNLVMNSLIHGFEGIEVGIISVRARLNGSSVALTFADTGVGLSAQVRARIFDPFFTTKRGQGGSGLGMHIVYNLVTGVLGGSIQAGGSEGHGIEILMSLPLAAPLSPPAPAAQPSA